MNNRVEYNFKNGAYVTIIGDIEATYEIKFINSDTEQIIYYSVIANNCWAKCSTEYFVNWRIEICENTVLWNTIYFNTTDKNILIEFDTSALGDTIAWIPYVEEFRKINNCNVLVYTCHKSLLENSYPRLTFTDLPVINQTNIYAKYSLGLYYINGKFDTNKHPTDPKVLPLQRYGADILGIKYREIKPTLTHSKPTKNKQVCLGIFSTKQQKFWNNKSELEKLTEWIVSKGYIVKSISSENDGYMGNYAPKAAIHIPKLSIQDTIKEINASKLFIGLSSGLSWLSWSLDVPTVVISGFSYPYTEMQDCIRISPPDTKCQGCFNRYEFKREDWYFCPDFGNSVRQFECTTSIKAEDIIPKIAHILN